MSPKKISVVTSHDISEPRGPRHAITAKRAFPNAEVDFTFYHSANAPRAPDTSALTNAGINAYAITFPTRKKRPITLARRKAVSQLSRVLFATSGFITQGLFGERTQNLTKKLLRSPADIYFAHNIETLLPAARAAEFHGASLIFDCMEYYSDMGDGQFGVVANAARCLEARWLPICKLVTASSSVLADTLANEYEIALPLAVYNAPNVLRELPLNRRNGLNLYWRNYVIGFGQRGLDDALNAMVHLPPDVRLFLQGHLPPDKELVLHERIEALSLRQRVTILPPHAPGEAVTQAAQYQVGLCLERKGPRNHDLTVSNKLFDYHMAGLAVVSSDLPGLASVIRRSGGGLLYEPGNVEAIVETILKLYKSPSLLSELQYKARKFALTTGNIDVEMQRLKNVLHSLF